MLKLRRIPNTPLCENIKAGKFRVSVQASDGHYCSPRTTLDNPNDYKLFEVAIFRHGQWVLPRKQLSVRIG